MALGSVLSVALLAAIVYVIYSMSTDGGLSQAAGIPLAILLYAMLGGGVFVFSYGYRHRDTHDALEMTGWIMFGALIVLVVVAVVVLKASDSDSDSKSDSDKKRAAGPSGGNDQAFRAADHVHYTPAGDTGGSALLDEAIGASFLLGDGPRASARRTPAGWYADPWLVAQQRYWDGTEWTGHTA